MEFIYGFAGALAALVLLGIGYFIGWKMTANRRKVTAEELGEAERRKLKEEQEAFHLVRNYTTERAYGMVDDDLAER